MTAGPTSFQDVVSISVRLLIEMTDERRRSMDSILRILVFVAAIAVIPGSVVDASDFFFSALSEDIDFFA